MLLCIGFVKITGTCIVFNYNELFCFHCIPPFPDLLCNSEDVEVLTSENTRLNEILEVKEANERKQAGTL